MAQKGSYLCANWRIGLLVTRNGQKLRSLLLEISFQCTLVNERWNNSLAGNTESGSIAGNLNCMLQIKAVEQIGGQGADKSISGSCIVDGRKVRSRKMFYLPRGTQQAAVGSQGDNDCPCPLI